MDFLNYLSKYEKENVSNTIKLVKENNEKLNCVLKEAFDTPFSTKTEAKLRVSTDFTNIKTAPKSVDVAYVTENMDSIIKKIDKLDEGSIKIIINNDVDKGKGAGGGMGGMGSAVPPMAIVPDIEVEESYGKGKKFGKKKKFEKEIVDESETTKVVIADKETGAIWSGVFTGDDKEKRLKGARKKNPNYEIMDFDKAEDLAKKYKEMDESKEELDEKKDDGLKESAVDIKLKDDKVEIKTGVDDDPVDELPIDGLGEDDEDIGDEESEENYKEPEEELDVKWSDIEAQLDSIEAGVQSLVDDKEESEDDLEDELGNGEEEEEILGDEYLVPESEDEEEEVVEEKKEELDETEDEEIDESCNDKDKIKANIEKISKKLTSFPKKDGHVDGSNPEYKDLSDKRAKLYDKLNSLEEGDKLKKEGESYLDYLMGEED